MPLRGCEASATGFLIGRHETTVHRLGKRVGGQPYGLSAKLINCMLASQHLPPLVRSKLIEYGEERIAGFYGGTAAQRARFAASLANVSDRQSIRRLRGDGTEIIIGLFDFLQLPTIWFGQLRYLARPSQRTIVTLHRERLPARFR